MVLYLQYQALNWVYLQLTVYQPFPVIILFKISKYNFIKKFEKCILIILVAPSQYSYTYIYVYIKPECTCAIPSVIPSILMCFGLHKLCCIYHEKGFAFSLFILHLLCHVLQLQDAFKLAESSKKSASSRPFSSPVAHLFQQILLQSNIHSHFSYITNLSAVQFKI